MCSTTDWACSYFPRLPNRSWDRHITMPCLQSWKGKQRAMLTSWNDILTNLRVSCWLIARFRATVLAVTPQGGRPEYRKVPVPPHRFTPLKENWMKLFTPVVDHLKLQMRLNLKTRNVEIKVLWMLVSPLWVPWRVCLHVWVHVWVHVWLV